MGRPVVYDPLMATKAYYPDPLLTAEQFLAIDFGEGIRAELDNGVVRMMSGGTARHARVQLNIQSWLRQALRASGCRPFGQTWRYEPG
jgi:plasmid replication initiation protein